MLDWEFPADRGGVPDDKPNFTKLLREFRKAVDNEEIEDENFQTLIISAAVAAGRRRIDMGYEVKEIVKYLDFINLMRYYFVI